MKETEAVQWPVLILENMDMHAYGITKKGKKVYQKGIIKFWNFSPNFHKYRALWIPYPLIL